jgi:hypothetical protein
MDSLILLHRNGAARGAYNTNAARRLEKSPRVNRVRSSHGGSPLMVAARHRNCNYSARVGIAHSHYVNHKLPQIPV